MAALARRRRRVAELDAEVTRLREENGRLRAELAKRPAPSKTPARGQQ